MISECRGRDEGVVTLSTEPRARPSIVCDGEIIFDSAISATGPVTAKTVRAALNQLNGVETVVLRFAGGSGSGSGGEIDEGLRIYTVLRECGRPLTAYIERAYSMGTVIAMAATDIAMVEGGEFMIHMPSISPTQEMTALALRACAAKLEHDSELLIDIYCRRTQIKREEIARMMNFETYFSAQEAVRFGFCDRVIPKPADDDCPLLHCPCRASRTLSQKAD